MQIRFGQQPMFPAIRFAQRAEENAAPSLTAEQKMALQTDTAAKMQEYVDVFGPGRLDNLTRQVLISRGYFPQSDSQTWH